MRLPRLYPIIDTAYLAATKQDPVDYARRLLAAGAEILQFRHKAEFERADFRVAAEILSLTRDAGAQFVINDRIDVALMLDADGVHLGQEDIAPSEARESLGPERLLGFSTHNHDQLRAGDSEPVDYLAIGPVFATASKQNPDPVVGLETIRQVRALTPKPLVAIGGITLDRVDEVYAAGADSVALISALDDWLRTRE